MNIISPPPYLRYCNICGFWPFTTEEQASLVKDICPGCQSRARHRALAMVMQDGLAAILALETKTMLACHILEEEKRALGPVGKIINFDVRPLSDLDLRMDIQDMAQIEESTIDCVMAVHVFNHVKDDRRALSEIRRVLKPGGFLLSSVGTNEGGGTIEIGDIERDYGAASLEKYAVGTYRSYGVSDYLALLGEFFASTATHLGLDTLHPGSTRFFVSRKEV